MSKEEKRERLTLNVVEKLPFETTSETMILPTGSLAEKISAIFSKVFADYNGCKFEFDPTMVNDGTLGYPTITLSFKRRVDNDSTLPMAFASRKYNASDTIAILNGYADKANSGLEFDTTEDATDILSKYILPKYINNKGEWNKRAIIREIALPSQIYYGTIDRYNTIAGIDTAKLIEELYGKNDGDFKYIYDVTVLRGAAASGAVLAVNRINEEHSKRITETLGMTAPKMWY